MVRFLFDQIISLKRKINEHNKLNIIKIVLLMNMENYTYMYGKLYFTSQNFNKK